MHLDCQVEAAFCSEGIPGRAAGCLLATQPLWWHPVPGPLANNSCVKEKAGAAGLLPAATSLLDESATFSLDPSTNSSFSKSCYGYLLHPIGASLLRQGYYWAILSVVKLARDAKPMARKSCSQVSGKNSNAHILQADSNSNSQVAMRMLSIFLLYCVPSYHWPFLKPLPKGSKFKLNFH